jgi:hypothetical protein
MVNYNMVNDNFLVSRVKMVLIKIHFKSSEKPYKSKSNHTTQEDNRIHI